MTGDARPVCGFAGSRRVKAISVPIMVAIRLSAPSACANARAAHTVSVRRRTTEECRAAPSHGRLAARGGRRAGVPVFLLYIERGRTLSCPAALAS